LLLLVTRCWRLVVLLLVQQMLKKLTPSNYKLVVAIQPVIVNLLWLLLKALLKLVQLQLLVV